MVGALTLGSALPHLIRSVGSALVACLTCPVEYVYDTPLGIKTGGLMMDIPQETVDDLGRRLRRIEGQVRGIQQMLADKRDCRDVLTQISAAKKALEQTGFLLIANGLTWCITHPAEAEAEGNSLDDLQRMFMKLT